MALNEEIERMAVARASTDDISRVARSRGMSTLREDGWLKVSPGASVEGGAAGRRPEARSLVEPLRWEGGGWSSLVEDHSCPNTSNRRPQADRTARRCTRRPRLDGRPRPKEHDVTHDGVQSPALSFGPSPATAWHPRPRLPRPPRRRAGAPAYAPPPARPAAAQLRRTLPRLQPRPSPRPWPPPGWHRRASPRASASAPPAAGAPDDATRLVLDDLLVNVLETGGSDLHLTLGAPPTIRVRGEMQILQGYPR